MEMPMKTIALDYDGTYTRDSDMWDRAIELFKSYGWRVLVVTARRDTEENVADVIVPGCSVVFTRLSPKLWFMKEKRGINVDIWIDDDPSAVLNGH